VQHDDPWVESFLALEREEPEALQALAALGISNTIEPPRHSLPTAKAESSAPAAETCLAPASPHPMVELDLLEGVQTAGSVPRSIMLRRGGGFPEVLCDGMVLLRSALDVAAQQAVVDTCRELGVGPGGFYSPKTRDGVMHLKMMCLGKHWDPVTSKYTATREVDGATPPPLPTLLWEPVVAAVAAARATSTSIPEVQPGVCLVNYYSHGGRLGMHQDRSESAEALRRGSPVVSLSIGDACDFAYSQTPPPREGDEALGLPPPRSVRLDSGDLLVFGGGSRLVWHGITKIYPRQRPGELRLIPGRLNLTFREY
jgi:alkylated DNA repair dioxygenase AlkB